MPRWITQLTLTEWFGYTGLIPFFASAVAVVMGLEGSLTWFLVYSSMILSFMAGACWGVAQAHFVLLNKENDIIGDAERPLAPVGSTESIQPRPDPISLSVSIAVFLFGLALLAFHQWLGPIIALDGLVTGYLVLFVLELRDLFRQTYSAIYRRMRTILTMVVVVLHLLVGIWLWFEPMAS